MSVPLSRRVVRSEVYLDNGNGHGSINTAIRRLSNTITNIGNDITYADSATLGASFTINTSGLYWMCYSDGYSAANIIERHGFSVNSTQLTTPIASINTANRLIFGMSDNYANAHGMVSVVAFLNAGDVVRPHDDTLGNGGPDVQVKIIRISD